MKLILLFLFFPLGLVAQKKDPVASRLHLVTDSFFYFRCREKCAMAAGKQDSVRIYDKARLYYQDQAYQLHMKWDADHYDARKQKTRLRYMDPDKYFKCPCQ
jgi:hypothetical protein